MKIVNHDIHTDCPQCHAPCVVYHDWNVSSYHYRRDEIDGIAEKLRDENKRLRIRLKRAETRAHKLSLKSMDQYFNREQKGE